MLARFHRERLDRPPIHFTASGVTPSRTVWTVRPPSCSGVVMPITWRLSRRVAAVAGALGAAGLAAVAARSYASDHQDTPLVEANPRFDVNDVYAFPSPRPGRVVLVLGTSSP